MTNASYKLWSQLLDSNYYFVLLTTPYDHLLEAQSNLLLIFNHDAISLTQPSRIWGLKETRTLRFFIQRKPMVSKTTLDPIGFQYMIKKRHLFFKNIFCFCLKKLMSYRFEMTKVSKHYFLRELAFKQPLCLTQIWRHPLHLTCSSSDLCQWDDGLLDRSYLEDSNPEEAKYPVCFTEAFGDACTRFLYTWMKSWPHSTEMSFQLSSCLEC